MRILKTGRFKHELRTVRTIFREPKVLDFPLPSRKSVRAPTEIMREVCSYLTSSAMAPIVVSTGTLGSGLPVIHP